MLCVFSIKNGYTCSLNNHSHSTVIALCAIDLTLWSGGWFNGPCLLINCCIKFFSSHPKLTLKNLPLYYSMNYIHCFYPQKHSFTLSVYLSVRSPDSELFWLMYLRFLFPFLRSCVSPSCGCSWKTLIRTVSGCACGRSCVSFFSRLFWVLVNNTNNNIDDVVLCSWTL